MLLQFFVILSVVLLELSLVLLKLNTGLGELLPELFDIESTHAEAAGQGQISVRVPSVWSLRVKLHLNGGKGRLYVTLLTLQSFDLLC